MSKQSYAILPVRSRVLFPRPCLSHRCTENETLPSGHGRPSGSAGVNIERHGLGVNLCAHPIGNASTRHADAGTCIGRKVSRRCAAAA